MRDKVNQLPSKVSSSTKTSGSDKFVSTFDRNDLNGIIISKRTSRNGVGLKAAIAFILIIGLIAYLMLDYLFF